MNWNETEASKCRYGDIAGKIFGNTNILWEYRDGNEDYNGHARILAVMPDNTYALYHWYYGSNSHCDTWEKSNMCVMNLEQLKKYYKINDNKYNFVNRNKDMSYKGEEDLFEEARNAVIKYLGN
jgi:hypothetical protein